MAASRETNDLRLQRLADLSIEIRMLNARVEAAMEERGPGESANPVQENPVRTFRNPLNSASCPFCGNTAGLALLPREYHRPTTPVRCFACHRDSSAGDWTIATTRVTSARTAAGARSSRGRQ